MPLLRKQAFTVSRPGTITKVKGRPIAGTPSSFTIRGNAQPLKGDDLVHLESGDINRARLALYSRTQLLIRDEVTDDATGLKYQVETSQDWSRQGMTKMARHHRMIMILKEDQ